MINVSFMPLRNGFPAGQASTLDVLVKVSSSSHVDRAAADRPALNLALVIDRSGSMRGKPLEEAKRCAEMIIDRLASRDRLALIAYDDRVDVLATSAPVQDKARLKGILAGLEERGTTDLHGGWEAGAGQAARSLAPSRISRVLLLSDGQANRGVTDLDTIARHCAELAAADVTTSTYGLGAHFNEELMTAMAKSGQGQAHYGQRAEDLIDPFQQEFDLLSALVARRLRLQLHAEPGVRVEVLNLFAIDPESRAHMLPDLALEGEVWALLRLHVDATVAPRGTQQAKLLSADLSYLDAEQVQRRADTATLYLTPMAPEVYSALPENSVVADRLIEVTIARLSDEARAAARGADWDNVRELTEEMSRLGKGNRWVEESIRALRAYAEARNTEQFSKEALYKSERMRNRMMSVAESSARWTREDELAKPSYLRKKGEEGRRF